MRRKAEAQRPALYRLDSTNTVPRRRRRLPPRRDGREHPAVPQRAKAGGRARAAMALARLSYPSHPHRMGFVGTRFDVPGMSTIQSNTAKTKPHAGRRAARKRDGGVPTFPASGKARKLGGSSHAEVRSQPTATVFCLPSAVRGSWKGKGRD